MKFYWMILIVFCFACNTEKVESNGDSLNLFGIQRIGEEKHASYTFCSIVPEKIDYTYRVGTWSFLTSNNVKIAEGEYNFIWRTVDSIGGCTYSYIENTIDHSEWKFWNSEGELVEPSQRMINLINYK